MKKSKMVNAWAWMMRSADALIPLPYVSHSETEAEELRSYWEANGYAVGPIVRIEVPAPKEASK